MIGTTRRRQEPFPIALLFALLAACGGGGGGGANVPPTIVSAAYVGAGTPMAGEELLLFFSEDVQVAGPILDDLDVALSASATLGAVATAPVQLTSRAIAVTLGAGVVLTPDTTSVALAPANDAVRDTAGALGTGGAAVVIGRSDGQSPTLTRVTVSGIDSELNGTGPAGGLLQVPPSGWWFDLVFSDNVGVNVARTRVTATVDVATSAGVQPAGTDLAPFLTLVSSTTTTARFLVPATTTFPAAPVTVSGQVVDFGGLSSAAASLPLTVRAFTNDVRPFETDTNPQQVWFLDFTRDIEAFTTSAIAGGVAVNVVNASNARSDFEDILHVLGLLSATPIANVSGTQSSNDLAAANVKDQILANLASLYSGANVMFTLTQPSGTFGGSSSVAYASLGFSRISIAGSASSAGVLGVAIFDPSNATQNDDTKTDFSGVRLGVFLHTIVNSGLGPPASSAFRMTFSAFTPSLGGTPIGNDAQDGQRLLHALVDSRTNAIDAAFEDLGRFIAVVTAHECGHSMGLVRNGAMPTGLYGNDATNFPGSQDGHIRTAALFPIGATNVMSPSLSYSSAINASTAFNTLNLAYLREQVFYGN